MVDGTTTEGPSRNRLVPIQLCSIAASKLCAAKSKGESTARGTSRNDTTQGKDL